jgi:predicted nuclease of predicted toxin-antitoxin system
MRFLVDECTGPRVASWLQELHHEVFSVYDDARGLDDESIIEIAHKSDYIIITNDKDFGELIFRMKKSHKGVILLRLKDERSQNKILILEKVLHLYSNQLINNFIVVTEQNIRIIEQKT